MPPAAYLSLQSCCLAVILVSWIIWYCITAAAHLTGAWRDSTVCMCVSVWECKRESGVGDAKGGRPCVEWGWESRVWWENRYSIGCSLEITHIEEGGELCGECHWDPWLTPLMLSSCRKVSSIGLMTNGPTFLDALFRISHQQLSPLRGYHWLTLFLMLYRGRIHNRCCHFAGLQSAVSWLAFGVLV